MVHPFDLPDMITLQVQQQKGNIRKSNPINLYLVSLRFRFSHCGLHFNYIPHQYFKKVYQISKSQSLQTRFFEVLGIILNHSIEVRKKFRVFTHLKLTKKGSQKFFNCVQFHKTEHHRLSSKGIQSVSQNRGFQERSHFVGCARNG